MRSTAALHTRCQASVCRHAAAHAPPFHLAPQRLETVQDAIVSLAKGDMVVYRSARVRLYANRLVMSDTAEEVRGNWGAGVAAD